MNRTAYQKPNEERWWTERRSVWKRVGIELPLMTLLIAVVIGIGATQALRLTAIATLSTSAAALITSVLLFQWRYWRAGWYASLIAFGMMAGWLHTHQMRNTAADELRFLASESWTPVVFEGKIDAVPRWRPQLSSFATQPPVDADPQVIADAQWQTLFEVNVTSIRNGATWQPAHGKLTLVANARLRSYLPGDLIRVYGTWERIGPPTNPGQFDMQQFYAQKGQFVRARTDTPDQITNISIVQRWRLDRFLAMLVSAGDAAIHRYVRQDQAALTSALVIGQREQVEWDIQESMLATGTMHLLAISGLNVEMVAISVIVFGASLRLPRRLILLLSSGIVICYAVLSGGQPPVVRAAVLVVSVCIGRWMGRTAPALNLLSLAGILLLIHRTNILFDIGTQLSFLAVACIAIHSQQDARDPVAADPLLKLVHATDSTARQFMRYLLLQIWEMSRTSAWVWLMTAPLILYTFHVVSPIAILLNVLLWLPILGALLSGLGILILGTWLPLIGYLFGAICTLCVYLVQVIVGVAEWVPGGHMWLPAPSLSWLIVYYVLVMGVWSVIGFARARRWLARIALIAWLLLGIVPSACGPRGKWPLVEEEKLHALRITFIDVGHGTCVFIQTPHDRAWLYDAGRMGDADRSFMGIVSVLWQEAYSRLDGLILSHADADHFNAMQGILQRFPVGSFKTTSSVIEHKAPEVQDLLRDIRYRGTPIETWSRGSQQTIDGVRFAVLHPPVEGVRGSDNANSLCLELRYAGRTLLLPGDLESPGTEELLQLAPRPIDVLMAPHHGSLTDKPGRILEWATPSTIVISGGDRAARRTVLSQFERAERAVFVTARDGAVQVTIDEHGHLQVFYYRDRKWNLDNRILTRPVQHVTQLIGGS